MSPRKKRAREQGLRCSLMPGECFGSRREAEEMRLTRQTNVALGGMVKVVYRIEKCRCGRHHLMTEQHFQKWENQGSA